MLSGLDAVSNLRSVARFKLRDYETSTVHPALVEEALARGWTVDKRNKRTVRLRRTKSHSQILEDRVWSLLYRVGFSYLSEATGATLLVNAKDPEGARSQIDVVGLDDEIALAIECKSSERPARRPSFSEELGKHSLIRERFAQTVNTQFRGQFKRQVVLAMFVSNIILSENDKARAAEANVLVFEDRDLDYYESLVAHLGPAAKYQLYADMLPGKPVPGLAIRIPAVRTKMGGSTCYTFSISPEYLLKISYVSHRSKGKASDVNTYQRMLSRSRMKSIREYITDDGIFPTNIVLNLEAKRITFDRIQQKKGDGPEQDSGLLGWLDIKPAYKSAWIIDGQHRLFAYSGHPRAAKSRVAVLAFEGLLPSKQAELFIDINAKQKSVKRSLLQELYAELHWDADEPQFRVRAIISKAIQELDADPESPLNGRVQMSDSEKDAIRCISLTSVFGAVEKTGFHIVKERKGQVLEFGPLWSVDGNDAILRRTVLVLKGWLNCIREATPGWWDKGSGEGGGLAMNDGVAACINVLRSVFQHLDKSGENLIRLDDEDLVDSVRPYGRALGENLASYSEEQRKQFRDLRGIQGQTARTRRCQAAIRLKFPDFSPEGLDEFLDLEKAQTNRMAKDVIDRIETMVQELVLDELRREFGADESQWWILGVPKSVRLKVTERFEEDDGKRGGKEYYFDLIDYRHIAQSNWKLFEPLIGHGGQGREKGTAWLNRVNDKRRIVAHSSSGVSLTLEQLADLRQIEGMLQGKTGGMVDEEEAVPEDSEPVA